MKKPPKKLNLFRETLRSLEPAKLETANGGILVKPTVATVDPTQCTYCYVCDPTRPIRQ